MAFLSSTALPLEAQQATVFVSGDQTTAGTAMDDHLTPPGTIIYGEANLYMRRTEWRSDRRYPTCRW